MSACSALASGNSMKMSRLNLEYFKFGLYVMFPIGIMYYFGTNLDDRFSVPDFWPRADQGHKIPTNKEDIEEELARLKSQRLYLRGLRLEKEAQEAEMRARVQGMQEQGQSQGETKS